ncbi:tail fiber domain-containing protein [Pseudomonas sp. M47T1]|uniref:tail fiber domain-containing protein n=1 Tax=Pseudomonas sp. M47T1 TaxID=1179778 RepID=UPI0012FA1A84|nr:tail fiber domain-containing protein [Pseudomonas sp. M47T1]
MTFSGSLTLTHNDANGYHILCLSGADVVTQPGDVAVFQKTGSSNEAKMVSYSRYDGTALVAGSVSGVLKLDGSTTMTGAVNEAPTVSMTAAATTDIGAAAGNTISLGGVATITRLGTPASAGLRRTLLLTAQTLVHDATYLVLPGSANITAQSGDSADFVSTAAGGWKCTRYTRNDGTPLVPYWPGGTVTTAINDAAEVSIASAATCAVGAAASSNVVIGGNAAISAFDTMGVGGARRVLRFVTALTLTHDATKLILPGGANITTAAGDFAEFECMDGTNWRCLWYSRADGTPLVGGSDSTKLPLAGGRMTGPINEAALAYVTGSGTTIDLATSTSNTVLVNGTGAYGSLGSVVSGAVRRLYFQQSCTLTNNSALVLPGGADIAVAYGDCGEFVSQGSGYWVCSNYQRASGAPVAPAADATKLPLAGGKMTGALNLATAVTLASAATVAIGAAAANTINISGTTTITAFDTIAAGARRVVVFAGVLTLTYSATALILPTAASITTAAGDTAEFESLGSGNWKCLWYQRATGLDLTLGTASQLLASTSNATAGVPALTAAGGQVTLSLTGTTARGNLAMATPAADGAGVVAGTVTASGGPSTAGATETRVGLFYFATDGSTATARGGAFNVSLKADGASGAFTPRLSINNAGVVTPGADNSQSLGSSSLRWSVVYAGTGTISTSDARDKTAVAALTDSELAAAKALSAEIGTYKFLAAVAAKGDDARLHAGMTVQRAMEIMTANGLEPLDYGFICHDTWEAVDEVLDEDGTIIVAAKEAGDKYSFRPDELLVFMARGFDARLAALEAAPVTS